MLRKPLILVLLFFLCGSLFAEEVPNLGELIGFDVSEYLDSIGEQGSDSNRLNTLGFYAYQEGDLVEAAKLWHSAVETDQEHVWANYNLACALSLFAEGYGRDPSTVILELEYGDPEVDGLFEYVDAVFDHLKRAVFYDFQTWHRMQEDSDLDLIRNMMGYQLMLLYPDNDPSELLETVDRWYAPNHGVFPGGTVAFYGDTVTMQSLVFDENGEARSVVESGKFIQEGNQITITIETPESIELFGEIIVGYDELGFIQYFYLTIGGTNYSSTPDYSA